MNARLSLQSIAEHLAAHPDLAGVAVSSGYAPDYLSAFGTTFPAVWVCAQRLTPTDNGRGYSGQYRQRARIDVLFRLIVQRYAAGQVQPEAELNALHDTVTGILTRYRPQGADDSFVIESSTDGDLSESVMTCDLVMSTTTVYASPAP